MQKSKVVGFISTFACSKINKVAGDYENSFDILDRDGNLIYNIDTLAGKMGCALNKIDSAPNKIGSALN